MTRGDTAHQSGDTAHQSVPLVLKFIDIFTHGDGFPEPIKAELDHAIQGIQLKKDFTGEILEVTNIFRSSSPVILGHLLDEFYGKMRKRGQQGRYYKELGYLWEIFTPKKEPLEGWMTTYVYGPLLAILLEDNPELKMTDVDGVSHRPGSKKMKHDAVLRYDVETFGWGFDFLDIMVMEAKPRKSGGEHGAAKDMKDYEKLREAMCVNLERIEHSIHVDSHPNLRTYGVQFRGFHTTLLEARIVGPRTYVFVSIDQFTIPSEANKDAPVDVLLKMI
ncbi:hypothetical protein BGX34_004078, partial [Mortierella sp. NVP85]